MGRLWFIGQLRHARVGIVKLWCTARYLLAALAWAGLVIAPLTMPATAMAVPSASGSTTLEASSAVAAEAMPCCPDEPAVPGCAKHCPFMIVCTGMAFPTISGSPVLLAPLALLAKIAPHSDAKLNGFVRPPPPRPPKA